MIVQLVLFGQLHKLAQIHDGHTVADVAHHAQVVGDEQVGQPQLGLQILQQIDYLGLNRDVESKGRLVADAALDHS